MRKSTDTLSRQWLMLKRVPAYPRRISTHEMHQALRAEGYKVDLRTTQRDLNRLSSEFPLYSVQEGRTNFWQWAKGAHGFEIPSMSPSTALAFSMIDRYLRRLLPNTTRDLLQPYISRAGASLNTRFRNWDRNVHMVGRGPHLIAPGVEPEVHEVVYTALLEGRQFTVYYRPRRTDEPVEYLVNPLGIVVREGITYLICTLWDYDDIKHLVLHRMSFAMPGDAPARRPERFDLRKYIKEDAAFAYPVTKGHIRLEARFEKAAAHHLQESRLSRDQEYEIDGDDHAIVRATVPDSSEIRWWLLGFGHQVEVLKPEGLREEFASTARRLAEIYR